MLVFRFNLGWTDRVIQGQEANRFEIEICAYWSGRQDMNMRMVAPINMTVYANKVNMNAYANDECILHMHMHMHMQDSCAVICHL
jgi:hypothetical protein